MPNRINIQFPKAVNRPGCFEAESDAPAFFLVDCNEEAGYGQYGITEGCPPFQLWTWSGSGDEYGYSKDVNRDFYYLCYQEMLCAPIEAPKFKVKDKFDRWSNELGVTIVATCKCDGEISYTTLQMQVSESQDLSIVGETGEECSYTWTLSCIGDCGGGSLSTEEGLSTTYTAPSENPDCEFNATISIWCCGVSVDSITIAINAYAEETNAYYGGYCVWGWGEGRIACCIGTYSCSDETIPPDAGYCYLGGWAECCATCEICYQGGTACSYRYIDEFCPPYDPLPYDTRSEEEIAAGCCPEALL